jgi:hypothetical protein
VSFVRFNPNVHSFPETTAALLRIFRSLDETQVAKNNYSATLNPTPNDDSGDGYSIGSIWINTTDNRVYILELATVGAASWILLAPEGGSAPLGAKFITQQPSADLSAEQALSALPTGILKSTTGTGVVSIATPGTDYALPSSVHKGEFRITLFAVATPVAFF